MHAVNPITPIHRTHLSANSLRRAVVRLGRPSLSGRGTYPADPLLCAAILLVWIALMGLGVLVVLS